MPAHCHWPAQVLARVHEAGFIHQDIRPGISFPSSHATMSVVVYGFLAFLLCRDMRHSLRRYVVSLTAMLVVSIALSRLYLGVTGCPMYWEGSASEWLGWQRWPSPTNTSRTNNFGRKDLPQSWRQPSWSQASPISH